MSIKYLMLDSMKKKISSIKKTARKVFSTAKEVVGEVVSPPVDTAKVDLFKEYLKIENPLWFKQIAYSSNTVIDHYRTKHLNGLFLTKPEYRQFLEALAECDANFK